MSEIPDHAEKILLSACLITNRRPSTYARLHHAICETFKCPHCGHAQSIPEHGIHEKCSGCNLQWVALGNSLNIWRDKAEGR